VAESAALAACRAVAAALAAGAVRALALAAGGAGAGTLVVVAEEELVAFDPVVVGPAAAAAEVMFA